MTFEQWWKTNGPNLTVGGREDVEIERAAKAAWDAKEVELAEQRVLDAYQQEYVQFLLGEYTEEEFMVVAEKYAIDYTGKTCKYEQIVAELAEELEWRTDAENELVKCGTQLSKQNERIRRLTAERDKLKAQVDEFWEHGCNGYFCHSKEHYEEQAKQWLPENAMLPAIHDLSKRDKRDEENHQLRQALEAIKLRIHYIGMPAESKNEDGAPDWSKEIALLEAALGGKT
jgi:hypothetical protein